MGLSKKRALGGGYHERERRGPHSGLSQPNPSKDVLSPTRGRARQHLGDARSATQREKMRAHVRVDQATRPAPG